MRARSWSVGAVAALALIGVALAVASDATSTETATASTPVASTDLGKKCADVYKVAAPNGNSVGTLCTAVAGHGTSISMVTITFTAASGCRESVMLRASGVDQNGTEFNSVKPVDCESGSTAADFRDATATRSGTDICGLLIAPDTYTGAQACVSIS